MGRSWRPPTCTSPSPSTAPAGTRRRGASRTPGPRELFTAGYWADLVTEAERGLLDLVTIEDTLGLQSSTRQPDDRTDQVRGRLDAVLVAARVAPLTRHIGIVPTQVVTHTEPFHASKAIATLDYVSTGRAGVRVRISHRPDEAALFGRRTFRAGLLDRDDPTAAAALADLLRRGRRLRRGAAPAVGQLGGRRGDPRRRHRPVRRPREAALHRLRGRALLASAARRSRRARRRGSRSSPRSRHRDVAYRLVGRSADLGFVTPRDAADAAAILAHGPRPSRTPPAAPARPLHVLGDVVVFLDESRRGRRGPQGAARRAARARVRQRRAGSSSARRPSSPTWLLEWQRGRA